MAHQNSTTQSWSLHKLFKENIYQEAHTLLHQLHTFGHGHSHQKTSQMHLLQVHPDDKNFPNRISFTLIS
jgi:hypothetical protein